MRSTTVLALLAPFAPLVSAHGWVTGVKAGGVWTAGASPNWFYNPSNRPVTAGWDSLNQDLGFVEPASAGTNDVSCHKSATAGKAYATVAAGQQLSLSWNTWPDSHKGPIINYIAPCNGDCTTISSSALRWSKISQGATVSGNTWVTDQLIANNFTSSTTIPRNLKAGNYVIRHEIIALHGAGSDNGAQLYPQCLNLKVTGSRTVAPTNGVAGPSLYKRTDPGNLVQLVRWCHKLPLPRSCCLDWSQLMIEPVK